MSKDNFIKMDAVILEVLPGSHYSCKLENGVVIRAMISGKMRMNRIRILPGDKVTVEISPYDVSLGRIVYRSKD